MPINESEWINQSRWILFLDWWNNINQGMVSLGEVFFPLGNLRDTSKKLKDICTEEHILVHIVMVNGQRGRVDSQSKKHYQIRKLPFEAFHNIEKLAANQFKKRPLSAVICHSRSIKILCSAKFTLGNSNNCTKNVGKFQGAKDYVAGWQVVWSSNDVNSLLLSESSSFGYIVWTIKHNAELNMGSQKVRAVRYDVSNSIDWIDRRFWLILIEKSFQSAYIFLYYFYGSIVDMLGQHSIHPYENAYWLYVAFKNYSAHK